MTDGQLLMPSVRLARKMGISRRTLKKRIDSKEIKAVKIGPRMFIPQNEIDRLMGISSGQISALKPATPNQVSGDAAEWVQTLPNAAKSPKARLEDILEGYADFLRGFEAGDPDEECWDLPAEKVCKVQLPNMSYPRRNIVTIRAKIGILP
jgi:excisionase family DNA binding protein